MRTIPRSRRNPQFNQETLPGNLQTRRIEYLHLKDLGGLRHPKADSINMGWRNLSFRGFADYMQTPEFDSGLEKLIVTAQQRLTAIMCAEALPWRCHRWLIADGLLVRGIQAAHIMTERTRKEHTLTEWAHVEGLQMTYPPTSDTALENRLTRTSSEKRCDLV